MSNALSTQVENTDVRAFTEDQVSLIRRQIAPNATPDELELFLYQCKRTGLDPLARQIYFQKYKDKMTIVTGIDGYRLIADMTGVYAGNDAGVFDGIVNQEWKTKYDSGVVRAPKKVTVTVWKIVHGTRMPFTATAYWSEYFPEKRPTMWVQMPMTMLEKCAEAKALRKAFPANLSGIYTREEMQQAEHEPVKVLDNRPAHTRRPSSPNHKTSNGNGATIEGEFEDSNSMTDVAAAPTVDNKAWFTSLSPAQKSAAKGEWLQASEGISRYSGNIHQLKSAAKKIIESGVDNFLLMKREGMTTDEVWGVGRNRVGLFDAVSVYAKNRDRNIGEFGALEAVHHCVSGSFTELLKPIATDNFDTIASASAGTQPTLIESDTNNNAQLM